MKRLTLFVFTFAALAACDAPLTPSEPTVAGPSFAVAQTKTIHLTVIDGETGNKVAGECLVFVSPPPNFTFSETNSGGQASVTVAHTATDGNVFCDTAAGDGSSGPFPIDENGVTHVTVTV